MKKTLFVLLTLLAGTFTLISCHDESVQYTNENTGTINLTTFSLTVEQENNKKELQKTRALADLEDFVVVLSTAAGQQLQEWTYGQMPAVFTLATGNYKLSAHSPMMEGAQFDVPYCYGESSIFEIKKNEVTDAGEVLCRLNSVKVTVKYDSELFKLMDDEATVTVSLGKESLAFAKNETRSGYFHAESEKSSVLVKFNAVIEGSPVEKNEIYTEVKRGTELIITYGIKDSQGDPSTGGSVTPGGITITEDCEVVELSFNVAPNDDVIGDFGKPSVTGQGFDISQHVTDLSKPVVVLLNAPEGMAHVNVNIQSTNPEFQGAVGAIFPTLPFDLAEPDEQTEANLKEFGFPYKEQIIGKQSVVEFNITSFLEPLSFFAGTHTFSIEVVDAYGDRASADLVIEINSKQ